LTDRLTLDFILPSRILYPDGCLLISCLQPGILKKCSAAAYMKTWSFSATSSFQNFIIPDSKCDTHYTIALFDRSADPKPFYLCHQFTGDSKS